MILLLRTERLSTSQTASAPKNGFSTESGGAFQTRLWLLSMPVLAITMCPQRHVAELVFLQTCQPASHELSATHLSSPAAPQHGLHPRPGSAHPHGPLPHCLLHGRVRGAECGTSLYCSRRRRGAQEMRLGRSLCAKPWCAGTQLHREWKCSSKNTSKEPWMQTACSLSFRRDPGRSREVECQKCYCFMSNKQ